MSPELADQFLDRLQHPHGEAQVVAGGEHFEVVADQLLASQAGDVLHQLGERLHEANDELHDKARLAAERWQ